MPVQLERDARRRPGLRSGYITGVPICHCVDAVCVGIVNMLLYNICSIRFGIVK